MLFFSNLNADRALFYSSSGLYRYKWALWMWITLVRSMESRINTETQTQTRTLQLLPTLIYVHLKALTHVRHSDTKLRACGLPSSLHHLLFPLIAPQPQLAVLTVQTLRISKHGALSKPIWLFHSWCCTSEPDPTNLLRDSTEQTSSKKLSTHTWGFLGWLVSSVTHQPYSIFLWCRCHDLSGPGFLRAVGKTRWNPRGHDRTLTVLQERSNVQQMFSWLQPQERRGKDDLLWERPHHAMHRRGRETIFLLYNEERDKMKTRRRLNLPVFMNFFN